MASGREHDKAIHYWGRLYMAIACFGGAAGFAWFQWGSVWVTLAAIAGYWMGGFLLVPDLDLWSVCKSRWGVFAFMWRKYSTDQSHRGHHVWQWGPSHWPIIGTLTRLGTLAGWTAAVLLLVFIGLLCGLENPMNAFGYMSHYMRLIFTDHWMFWAFWAAGVEIACLVHLWKDLEASYLIPKRKRSRGRG